MINISADTSLSQIRTLPKQAPAAIVSQITWIPSPMHAQRAYRGEIEGARTQPSYGLDGADDGCPQPCHLVNVQSSIQQTMYSAKLYLLVLMEWFRKVRVLFWPKLCHCEVRNTHVASVAKVCVFASLETESYGRSSQRCLALFFRRVSVGCNGHTGCKRPHHGCSIRALRQIKLQEVHLIRNLCQKRLQPMLQPMLMLACNAVLMDRLQDICPATRDQMRVALDESSSCRPACSDCMDHL